jgi:hypothetical protein
MLLAIAGPHAKAPTGCTQLCGTCQLPVHSLHCVGMQRAQSSRLLVKAQPSQPHMHCLRLLLTAC